MVKHQSNEMKQREKLSINEEQLQQRINNMSYGDEKSKDWARRWLDVESRGQVGLSLFPVPPIIERGSGDKLYDVDGKEYIDLLSGFSVSALGQCNPEITKTISEQAGKLTHYFDFPHPERIEMAEKLTKMTPIKGEDARVVFGVTGSDSVELAIRAARYYTGRSMVLTAYGDYHGVTYGAMPFTTKGGMRPYFHPIQPQDSGVGYFPFPYAYRGPFGEPPTGESAEEYTLSKLKHYLEFLLESKETPYAEGKSGISNVAAIIVEPFQSSAGYYIPPKGYLKFLRKIADEYGILLIVDEIQTGLGRTGRLWATEWEDVEVDMLLTSKALGGGLPLSAAVARADILEAWGPGAHVSTQAGNVIACAAGNKILDQVSDEAFLKSVKEKGDYFANGLRELQRKYPIIGQIDARGLYIGLEFVKDQKTKEPADEEAQQILEACLEEGIIFEKGGFFHNRFQLIPPLTISYETIDEVIARFDKILSKVNTK
ncbi:aspartate aminotransferase family protein [Virgibacillus sp. W0181]|uniref:aspartate aminotransferase family protein n=1 Tax=Virgibacillus sp. W0181 TaxID=3391581 RepID=UPI003F48BE91